MHQKAYENENIAKRVIFEHRNAGYPEYIYKLCGRFLTPEDEKRICPAVFRF